MERLQHGTSTSGTSLPSLVRRPGSNLTFDRIQLPNTLQGFGGQWRSMRYLQLIELASYVRPAGRFLYPSTLIKMMESGVGIGLQDATEAAQMFSRMLTTTIRRVGKPHRCRRVVTGRTIIPHIGPQAPGLGLAVARSQHRNRRVIRM